MEMSSENMLMPELKFDLSQKDWSDQPPELLEKIYKKLVISGQARFALICKPWLFVAASAKSHALPEPWLVFRYPHGDRLVPENKNEFFGLSDNRFYRPDAIIPNEGCEILGSCNGWIVTQRQLPVAGKEPLVLVNPILNAEIKLPPISSDRNVGDIKKLVVVVETTGDISVVTSVILLATNFIISIKLDRNRWEYHYICNSEDIVYYKGKIYALEIHPYTVLTVISWDEQMKLLPMQFQVVQGIFHPSSSEKNRAKAYLVESGEDLLIVTRQVQTGGFDVFKLVEGKCCVDAVKQQSLGDQALFSGRGGCISLSVGEFSQFEGNHIYFIDTPKEKEEEHGVYSLKDGCTKSIFNLNLLLA
ncbi:F-box protein At2g26160-like [Argentina anserina]|uniref:F-box protein At2g26160-like n=1 Tax=Argentina anserina TaxID=57926 RepID=UPI0021767EF4|nr:F-box protein At2g26160-like [Potentilla anserina]